MVVMLETIFHSYNFDILQINFKRQDLAYTTTTGVVFTTLRLYRVKTTMDLFLMYVSS